jgi:riboflavin kinase/FMN adenylyltransferase
MKLYKGISELAEAPKNVVATIGNFDGVHLGHQTILHHVRDHAERIGGTPVAVTFRPHPLVLLKSLPEPHLLNTYEEKTELLSAHGMNILVEEKFTREFSNMSPEAFVNDFLVRGLNVRVLYLGYDFTFGKERAGSVDTLKRLAEERGVEVHVVPPLEIEGKAVSSSRIRKALDMGRVEEANACLGRPFFLSGLVWRGDGRGRTIGFPTANLKMEFRKTPRTGVYATKARWKGKWYKSVTNIGYNPTFIAESEENPIKVETHFLDFDEDLYGQEIRVEFYSFLRAEKKFSGVEELVKQIHADVISARKAIP